MLPLIEKYYGLLIGLLIALLGLAMGQLAAVGLGLWLQSERPAAIAAPLAAPPAPKGPALADYEPILQRNLFDAASRGGRFEKAAGRAPSAAAAGERAAISATAPKDMALFGTVAGGERPLALLRIGGKMVIGHLEERLPGGAVVEAIERTRVVLLNPDGSAAELLLHKEQKRAGAERRSASAAKKAGQYRIQEVGENRWVIPKEEADRARGNLGELLKTAHMVPNVVGGKTVGFTVRMIQPRSLLALLGMKRGDVLHEVNGVSLDSPEKALQIFQQLREARSITIGLERGGQRMTFDYEVE